jgi:hypothetical protein
MIGEAIVAGVVVSFIATLRFMKYVLAHEAELLKQLDPKEEKRRVLERQRNWWVGSMRPNTAHAELLSMTNKVLEIDKQLLALADEKEE